MLFSSICLVPINHCLFSSEHGVLDVSGVYGVIQCVTVCGLGRAWSSVCVRRVRRLSSVGVCA